MRRETDFVLEQAAWPALLLEATGTIRRANRAARQIFGEVVRGKTAALAALWGEKNPVGADRLLTESGKEATHQLKLRLTSGSTGVFIAHVSSVIRDGQNYFVLQLFKESGGHFPELAALAPSPPATPAKKTAVPEKSETAFGLENAPWPALLVEKNGAILHANPAAAQVFGKPIEKPDSEFASIWFEGNQESVRQFLDLPPGGEAKPIQYRVKGGAPAIFITQCCPTARKQECLVQLFKEVARATPVPAAPAEPATVTTAPVPATAPAPAAAPAVAAQPAETSLSQKQKLERAMQLARSVAVDFNNVLTGIVGHTSFLLSKAEPNHPWRSSLIEVEKSAARAAEIANDLAAFSRQEKETPGQSAGNLNLLLQRCVESFQRASPPEKAEWSLTLERRLFMAKFDEAKMQQAFAKIIENAIEALRDRGRITVQSRNLQLSEPTQDRTVRLAAGAHVCVEISDNGCGIEPEVLPRIFEPFFTTKRDKHRGVGLALVYGIVTNHGGGVAVSSQPGVGTSVRVYLPAETQVVPDSAMTGEDLKGNQTILFVDDEDLLLTMGQTILSAYGYRVLTANSGQKALDILSQSDVPVDLVITDLLMPVMSGRELVEHVRRLTPGTRVLCTSGYTWPTNKQEDAIYLQKPFTSQELLRKVKHVLTIALSPVD